MNFILKLKNLQDCSSCNPNAFLKNNKPYCFCDIGYYINIDSTP